MRIDNGNPIKTCSECSKYQKKSEICGGLHSGKKEIKIINPDKTINIYCSLPRLNTKNM